MTNKQPKTKCPLSKKVHKGICISKAKMVQLHTESYKKARQW